MTHLHVSISSKTNWCLPGQKLATKQSNKGIQLLCSTKKYRISVVIFSHGWDANNKHMKQKIKLRHLSVTNSKHRSRILLGVSDVAKSLSLSLSLSLSINAVMIEGNFVGKPRKNTVPGKSLLISFPLFPLSVF
jgi:hypothetical protein